MFKLVYLPTDAARLQILKAFYEKLPVVEGEESAFTEEQLLKIGKYYSIFEKMKAYEDFLSKEQEKQDKEYNDLFAKAKIFVNHYFVTMQMAIDRGELPAATANFYGLTYPFTIPSAENGEELLQVADSLFTSDSMRVGTGGKYFANPSIGAVKVWVEKFKEAWEKKTNKFNVKRAEVEGIDNIRQETDKLINDIYSYFEAEYSDMDFDEQKRLFAGFGMTIELCESVNEENPEPVKPFFEEELSEDKKENKSNGGTTGINQLKFDLFFPES